MIKSGSIIGTCITEGLIDQLFGSVTNFAQLIEEYGNEFILGDIQITYNEDTDIHTFSFVDQRESNPAD